MKKVIGTMLGFYVFVFWIGNLFAGFIFPGDEATVWYLNPIYLGMIVLSGIIVTCTVIIVDEIKALKKDILEKNTNSETNKDQ